MRFRLEVDGREYVVQVTPAGVVVIDGERFQAQVVAKSGDRRLVRVGDKTYDIRVAETQNEEGHLALEVAGDRVAVKVYEVVRERVPGGRADGVPAAVESSGASVANPRRAAGQAAIEVAEGEEGVRAPMPGKIVSVLVAVDEVVEEGQAVLVLEAMKMENELRAPRRGRIRRLFIDRGDPVEKDQLLMTIS